MKAVKNIDWELFNKQRLILADLLDGGLFLENEEWEEAVEGIVNLLDAMSDEKYYSDKAKEITKKF